MLESRRGEREVDVWESRGFHIQPVAAARSGRGPCKLRTSLPPLPRLRIMVTVLDLARTRPAMDFPKKRTTFASKEQDPMSHRIIEKRRRDRMNNCLADLSRLIPTEYLKKGRGRIEKTEIIEMAIKHLKYLQERANCIEQRENGPISAEHFRLGYQECLSEVMRYLVEGQGHLPRDTVCVQLINHLQRHCDNIMKGDVLNKPRSNPDSNNSSSSSSSNYMIHNQSNIPKNFQCLMTKNVESSERIYTHTSMFDQEDKPIVTNEDFQRLPQTYMEENREEINESQDDKNIVVVNNESSPEMKPSEEKSDELKDSPEVLDSVENDRRSVQDVSLVNSYSPVSSSYYSHPVHRVYCDSTLRIRNGDAAQRDDSGLGHSSIQGDSDYLHSYKFKNTIKQRFSQSQSTDYFSSSHSDMTNSYNRDGHSYLRREHEKGSHKKRKISNQGRHLGLRYEGNQKLSSETNSSDNTTSVSQNSGYQINNIQVADLVNGRAMDKTYLQHGHHMVRHSKANHNFSKLTRIGVPIFALHAKGAFYVPLNVDYECLTPFLGSYDLLDAAIPQSNTSLHPITISVNFQPMFFTNKNQI